jgi:hypothetical protein
MDFYGWVEATPRIFVCGSDACDVRMGFMGGKARAYGSTFILVYSEGRSPEFFAHELSHIELHQRIGLRLTLSGAIPAWFDEGLAALVSNDPRYVGEGPDGEPACVVAPDGPLPTGPSEWSRTAGMKERPIYAMAACAVISWDNDRGGREGLLAAIDDIAASKATTLP